MEIVLVRHGESIANRLGMIQGRGDYALTDSGREQARLTAAALADYVPRRVYSSPLMRARETAEIINLHHQAELVLLPDLMEYSLGEYEGLVWDEVVARQPDIVDKIKSGIPFHHLVPGAETDEQAAERADRAYFEIIHSGLPRVLVVAHLGILELLVKRMAEGCRAEIEAGTFPLGNCSISRFELGLGQGRVVFINNRQHLLSAS